MRRVAAVLASALIVVGGVAPVAGANGSTSCSTFPEFEFPPEAGAPAPVANQVIDQTVPGDLVVEAGSFCEVIGSTIIGNIVVESDAIALGFFGSTVEGNLTLGSGAQSLVAFDEREADFENPDFDPFEELPGSFIGGSIVAEDDSLSLTVAGAEVGGSVRLGRGVEAGVVRSEVGGNYTCQDCLYADLVGSRVDGNVRVSRGQDGGFIEPFEGMSFVANEIDGNVTIRSSRSEQFEYRVIATAIRGNVQFTDNEAALVMAANAIDGNLSVARNTLSALSNEVVECFPIDDEPSDLPPEFMDTGVSCFLDPDEMVEGTLWAATFAVDAGVVADNTVDGNVQVLRNMGEAVQVAENTIAGNLTCRRNDPAPVGGGNAVDGRAFDQCRGL